MSLGGNVLVSNNPDCAIVIEVVCTYVWCLAHTALSGQWFKFDPSSPGRQSNPYICITPTVDETLRQMMNSVKTFSGVYKVMGRQLEY